jgi:hypothetical protein
MKTYLLWDWPVKLLMVMLKPVDWKSNLFYIRILKGTYNGVLFYIEYYFIFD